MGAQITDIYSQYTQEGIIHKSDEKNDESNLGNSLAQS